MTDVTIKTLAAERQTSVERLVQQFADAGIRKSADDSVSAQEKQTLIDHLNQKNSGPDKLTLQRKTRSTLNIPGTGGKSKSVQIEVRKKRTFVKRDPQEAERLAAEEQAQREAEEQARREAEESAKREAQQKAEREAAEQAKREAAEQAKREAAEKDKVSNQQDDMTKNAQAEKARREQEAAELKRKAEEEARRKLEKKHVALLKKHVVWRKKTNGLITRNRLKIPAIITSLLLNMLARQKTKAIVKSKAAVAVVVTRKQRVRRKATNTLNQKLIVKKHAQQYVAVKAENVKVLRCSKASRSLLRPLTVTL